MKFSRPLRKHQADCLDRFADEPLMALLHEMGVGKTMTAIAWCRAKYQAESRIKRTLVISPVATLYNWLEEFKINAPEKVWKEVAVPYMRTKKTRYTGAEKAEFIEKENPQILILNPESLDSPLIVKALRQWKPEVLVVDEAHRFKNFKAKRLKALLFISDAIPERAILTGTPILNSYLDLWAQFRILDLGKTFGANFYLFRERYFMDRNAGLRGSQKYFPDYQPKKGIEVEISAKLAEHSSRLTKADCLDLPPLVYETRHVELSPEQRKAYDAMEDEMLAEIAEGTCATTNALTRLLRLSEILSGYLPVETREEACEKMPVQFLSNPRLSVLKELIEEISSEHKIIIWCTFKENYRVIKEMLKDLGLGYAELTGDTKDRQGEIDRFQTDPACCVMVSNPKAGGIGINLTAASYAIYYSRSHSLGDRLQSEARNHRGGSEIHKSITIIDLVCKGTLDEDILKALLRKENFSDNILDRLKAYAANKT